ncbi:hypothetical protein [Gaetbulibacter aestuarii]|uniref:Uncharacterized protein n=1 Tax=Gaetbulibacter aestuarii TaxID=1502358 RepID=A0ABW7N404_9FLAO
MKYTVCLFIFFSTLLSAQESIPATFIDSTKIQADQVVSVDNFGNTYFIKDNVFFKKTDTKILRYINLQLGNLSTAQVFNPLKINLFYQDFNTVVILDNRLAEIAKIDFNTLPEYRNITHISTGSDNTLWIFNQDRQQLERFDYKLQKTVMNTLPITSPVLDMISNYNTCWLLTQNNLYIYNYFGSVIQKIKNTGYTKLCLAPNGIVLEKENKLFYLKLDDQDVQAIKLPNLLIKQFFVTNETLYIYNFETLAKHQIKID